MPITHQHVTPPNTQQGFGLLEVLITVLILGLGLLGLAGMQVTSLNYNNSAYYRGQATLLSYDMADRMRANQGSLASYLIAATGAELAVGPSASCRDAGCNSATMARSDVIEWTQALDRALPGGQGAITLTSGTYTINVTWTETSDGNARTFQMDFLP